MYGSQACWTECHTFVSYFRVFQLSAILYVFGLHAALKLGCITKSHDGIHFFGDIEFVLISSCHICIRSIRHFEKRFSSVYMIVLFVVHVIVTDNLY